jgi:iron-sulfur cluster repair protein YtfE (RIC family)
MLTVFKRLFGQTEAGVSHALPAGKLLSLLRRYRPGLIANLRDQHKQLLALFADLERASEQQNASACRQALHRFARMLEQHLALEDRELYGYFLSHAGHVDPDVMPRVRMMSTDMMHVGRILQRFVSAYSSATLTPEQLAQLRHDLPAIGEVLAHRIHEEESVLYPLYVPR